MPVSPTTAEDPPDLEHGRQMMLAAFEHEVAQISEGWMEGVESLEDWEARRPELRRKLAEMLGLWPAPEKNDLQVEITGTADHEELSVYNLHFQALPGLYITGNLYVPKNLTTPAPAVLYLCGHASRVVDGVSYGAKVPYQRHPAWYARHGMVSLAIDTLTNGEIQGHHRGTHTRGRWWWYNRGYTPAALEAWSAIRALDLLEARPEVDRARLGVTGRSGGGMYSWLLLALDDRPAVATPTAGITDLHSHLIDGVIRGHCDCNYWNNTYRLDVPVLAALAAPRPVRLLNTDADHIFPEDGVHRVDRQVGKIYALYGKEEAWDVFIGSGPHGDTPELREATFSWMHKWLKGEEPAEIAPAEEYFSNEELRVLQQIPADERNSRIDQQFMPVVLEPPVPDTRRRWERMKKNWMDELSAKSFAGWPARPPDSAPPARLLDAKLGEHRLQVHEFSPQKSITLRLWGLGAGEISPERVVVRVLDEEGWLEWLGILQAAAPDQVEEIAGPGARAVAWPEANQAALASLTRRLAEERAAMVLVAPRGIGPTRFEIEGPRGDTIRRSFQMLGQTRDGMRVWDLRQALSAIRSLPGFSGAPLQMEASGSMAGVALYASLFDAPLDELRLRALPSTHANGPYLLNINQILEMPQVVAMARDRARVILLDTDPAEWTWPQGLDQALADGE